MNNLKRIREAAGLSQAQLATAAGVPKRTIESYEQGERDIRKGQAAVVTAIAEALKVDITELWKGEE